MNAEPIAFVEVAFDACRLSPIVQDLPGMEVASPDGRFDWDRLTRPGYGARGVKASTQHRKSEAARLQAKLSVEVQIQISNVQRRS